MVTTTTAATTMPYISQKDDTPTVLSCMLDEPNHYQHQQLDMDHIGQGMNSAYTKKKHVNNKKKGND